MSSGHLCSYNCSMDCFCGDPLSCLITIVTLTFMGFCTKIALLFWIQKPWNSLSECLHQTHILHKQMVACASPTETNFRTLQADQFGAWPNVLNILQFQRKALAIILKMWIFELPGMWQSKNSLRHRAYRSYECWWIFFSLLSPISLWYDKDWALWLGLQRGKIRLDETITGIQIAMPNTRKWNLYFGVLEDTKPHSKWESKYHHQFTLTCSRGSSYIDAIRWLHNWISKELAFSLEVRQHDQRVKSISYFIQLPPLIT